VRDIAAAITASLLLALGVGVTTLNAQMSPVGAFLQGAKPAQLLVMPGDITTYTVFYSCDIAYNGLKAKTNNTKACQLALMRPDGIGPYNIDPPRCDVYVGPEGTLDFTGKTSCTDLLGNPNAQTVADWASMRAPLASDVSFHGNVTSGVLYVDEVFSGTILPGMYFGTGGSSHQVWVVQALGAACDPAHPTLCGQSYQMSGTFPSNPNNYVLLAPWVRVVKIYDQLESNACGGQTCDAVTSSASTFINPKLYRFGFGGDGVCSKGPTHSCLWGDGVNVGQSSAFVSGVGTGATMSPTLLTPSNPVGLSAVGMTSTNSGWIGVNLNAADFSTGMYGDQLGTNCIAIGTGSLSSMQAALGPTLQSGSLTLDGSRATASGISGCNVRGDAQPIRVIGSTDEMSGEFYYSGLASGVEFTATIQGKLCGFDNHWYGTPTDSDCLPYP
jgi:hypothetical protein